MYEQTHTLDYHKGFMWEAINMVGLIQHLLMNTTLLVNIRNSKSRTSPCFRIVGLHAFTSHSDLSSQKNHLE